VVAQLGQLFTAAPPVQLGEGNTSFSAAVSSRRLLPYSSTLKVCVRSGVLMLYSPTRASAARGKDRSTMPPTGVTFSHCAIRFPLGSCVGSSRVVIFQCKKGRAFLPVPLTKSIYRTIALWRPCHCTDSCKTVAYYLLVSRRDRRGPSYRPLW